MNLLCVHILKHVFINIHINIKIFSYKNAFDIKLCCAIWRDAMVFKSTVSSHRRPGIDCQFPHGGSQMSISPV